ncbi:hypothetical protein CK203_101824 [Vitis vinifera]|uniref:Reverse transcriptase zinc-binding domain-containing protein n=1 Tax=Vitis vinifera TaxID=29760 RepID=A0A438ET82_VITVI|nr:hypothetical protein CK203_101824 [Vitis vinifera]
MGGLGFGKTSMRNSALLGKWLWRFPRERSGLWHKVIASIYGTHPNGWDANIVVRWSHRCPWKAIAQVFQEFSPFVRLVVGNGERIRLKSVVFVFVRLVFSEIFFLCLVKSFKSFNVPSGQVFMELKSPSKVKALAWLVAHGKVPPRSLEDMLVISFKGLGNSLRGKTLWQIACLTLIWMVWQERNNRIFEDKGRTEEMVWDLIQFYSSLWASCTEAFRGVPLSILQLNWIGEGPLILPLITLLLHFSFPNNSVNSLNGEIFQNQMSSLEEIFNWLSILWERGLCHDNPQVRCLIMQSFLGIEWKKHRDFAKSVPESFVFGSFMASIE